MDVPEEGEEGYVRRMQAGLWIWWAGQEDGACIRHVMCTTVNDADGPFLNGFDLVRLFLCNLVGLPFILSSKHLSIFGLYGAM